MKSLQTFLPILLPTLTVLAGLLAASAPARAQDAAADTAVLRTRTLAAHCAQCHGTDGRGTPGAVLPGLAGLPAPFLVEQLKAFRGGTRQSTLMQQLAKGYSDAQIEQLAKFFAAQPVGTP